MRYYYEKKPQQEAHYGYTYICDSPVYNECTVFNLEDRLDYGFAVIQQYRDEDKKTWWGKVEDCIIDDLYLNENFRSVALKLSMPIKNGLFHTVTLRSLMRMLDMKPIKREPWETYFA